MRQTMTLARFFGRKRPRALSQDASEMRIAILPSAFWPAVGGVEELTRRLADTLRDAGDQVEVWAPWDARQPTARRETWQGLPVRRFPHAPPASEAGKSGTSGPDDGRGTMATDRRGERVPARCAPCAVLWSERSICHRPVRVYPSAPRYHPSGRDDHGRPRHLRTVGVATNCFARRAPAAAAVTGCSAFTLSDAQRFGLKPGQGRVIFNGVRLDESPVPEEEHAQQTSAVPVPFERYVLALGRVVHKKGFDLLLKAFAELACPAEVGLVIGGDGAALASVRALALDLGLARSVFFPGRLNRARVAELMRGAEVFVMPSRLEPFGIVVLEAWRAGTAVVATTHGGHRSSSRMGLTDCSRPVRCSRTRSGDAQPPVRPGTSNRDCEQRT